MPSINIEIIYPLPDEQKLLTLAVKSGSTIEQAIHESGILELYPEIDLNENKVGIFSKASPLETELREGDRIEIYRPLIADPKEVRRQKALKKKPE
ncbi:MAG: RnfH family protein [Gammaproteobacteria bacterium]|nr:RnfH family protein [Gammaproteobacteria bacterium]MDH5630739.1 RnfH family protein [Gammaproteobacteria bacterium]